MTKSSPKLEHAYCDVGGVRLHYVRAGRGPLVVLLHGFPECWYSWRHQIWPLAERFTVVAPDLRGYNLSDKPKSGYDLDTLAGDVTGLIQNLGFEKAHVVGHDWGGVIAFWLPVVAPERVEKLVVLNAPHPARFQEELLHSPRQRRMSWYMAFFQIPLFPEYLLTLSGAEAIEQILLRGAVNKEAFTKKDLRYFRRAAARPGAMRCALAYYRGIPKQALRGDRQRRRILCPTLLLWGRKDKALGLSLTEKLDRFIPNLEIRLFDDAGHWLQQERPTEVSQVLLEFLAGGSSG